MVTTDGKKVVYYTSFLVKNDQEVLVDAPIETSTLKLAITFASGTSSEERSGTWRSEDGLVRFTFSGWNNPYGTVVSEPTKFGEIRGKKVYFQLAHHYVGEVNLVHLYVLVGDQDG